MDRDPKPLDGLLVVAVEQAVSVPLCTARLRDAGARIIKIERPEGDFARGYDTAAGGDSSYFAWTNHGKESIVLDFKAADDAALLHRMLGQADVLVHNLGPGAMARAGFGSDVLRAANPGLITCAVSGYGDAPGMATRKAYDLLIQAESGLIDISGGPSELGRIGVSIVDIGTGMTAHAAILEALLARSVSGRGRALQISLFDVAAEWMTVPLVQHECGSGGPTRVGLHHPSIAPYGAYATSEQALTLISIQNEREWVRLCAEVMDRPDLATDPRFVSNNLRVGNRAALDAELHATIGAMTRREFQRRLDHADLAYGSVSSLDDLSGHPALRRRTVVPSGGGPPIDLPAHPVRRTGAGPDRERDPEPTRRTVPPIGAHTDQIRAEFS